MMITEDLLRIQNWYIHSLRAASQSAITPGARALYEREAIKAMDEFYETYGEVLPCLTTMH